MGGIVPELIDMYSQVFKGRRGFNEFVVNMDVYWSPVDQDFATVVRNAGVRRRVKYCYECLRCRYEQLSIIEEFLHYSRRKLQISSAICWKCGVVSIEQHGYHAAHQPA